MQAWTVWALGHAGSHLDGQPGHIHRDQASEVRRADIHDLLRGNPLDVYVRLHSRLLGEVGQRLADSAAELFCFSREVLLDGHAQAFATQPHNRNRPHISGGSVRPRTKTSPADLSVLLSPGVIPRKLRSTRAMP